MIYKELLKKFFLWVFIFPLLDVISTIFFVSKFSIDTERNLFGRFFMNNLGNFAFPVMYL